MATRWSRVSSRATNIRVKAPAQPQALEVVVGRHRADRAAQRPLRDEQRHDPQRQEVRADDRRGPELLDHPDGVEVVDPVPRLQRAGHVERLVALVVAPADEPGHGLHEREVAVVVEQAVDLVRRAQDVELHDLVDVGLRPERGRHGVRRHRVAGADARTQDQDARGHARIVRAATTPRGEGSAGPVAGEEQPAPPEHQHDLEREGDARRGCGAVTPAAASAVAAGPTRRA